MSCAAIWSEGSPNAPTRLFDQEADALSPTLQQHLGEPAILPDDRHTVANLVRVAQRPTRG